MDTSDVVGILKNIAVNVALAAANKHIISEIEKRPNIDNNYLQICLSVVEELIEHFCTTKAK